jgi:hypothetical protein
VLKDTHTHLLKNSRKQDKAKIIQENAKHSMSRQERTKESKAWYGMACHVMSCHVKTIHDRMVRD